MCVCIYSCILYPSSLNFVKYYFMPNFVKISLTTEPIKFSNVRETSKRSEDVLGTLFRNFFLSSHSPFQLEYSEDIIIYILWLIPSIVNVFLERFQFWATLNTNNSYLKGYNHPALLSAFNSDSAMRALVNRPALGVYPGADWATRLNQVLMSVAPQGLDQVKIPRARQPRVSRV